MFGAITSRAEAHVMRLACKYALLDLSSEIRLEHLEAALALWRYCEASAHFVFGDATGEPVADEILGALIGAPRGLSRTEIRDLFSRHKPSAHIENSLSTLERTGLAHKFKKRTGGAPVEVWVASRGHAQLSAARPNGALA